MNLDTLSPGDLDALEDIHADLELPYREIIDLALRRMQQDLDAGSGGDVIEDVRREVAWRRWCAEQRSEHLSERSCV